MMNEMTTQWSRRRDLSPASPRHILQFYETENFLCKSVGDWIAGGIAEGEPTMVIASARRAEAIGAVMWMSGTDVSAAVADGCLVMFDAEELLAVLMRGNMPDERLFREAVVPTLERTTGRENFHTRIFGEMADLLFRSGRHDASLRLEELWNELAVEHWFSLLCAHDLSSFYEDEELVYEMCRRHGRVNPAA